MIEGLLAINSTMTAIALVYMAIAVIFLISGFITRFFLFLLLEDKKSSISFPEFFFSCFVIPVIAAIWWPAIVFVYFVCLIGNDWSIDFSFDLDRWKWLKDYVDKWRGRKT